MTEPFSSLAAAAPAALTERRSGAAILRIILETLAMIGATTLAGLVIAPRWGTLAVDMLYLPPVLAAATLFGLRPALFAAVSSALAYNFFFTEPIHTFRISSPDDLLTVAILLVVGLVTSQLAARMREQARAASDHAARNATIAGFARQLLSCASEDDIGRGACRELAALFDCNATLVAGEGEPRILAMAPQISQLTPSDLAAAAYVLKAGEPAGRGAARIDPADWLFLPVKSASLVLAAVGLARDDGARPVAPSQEALLDNITDQLALAIERARLEAETRGLAALRERDRLRGALLSSVGHDLRTPLTAIIASASELRPDAPADRALVQTIAGEASKLERYISNLLDMARVEAGAVRLKVEAVDLVDAVSAALRDLHHLLDDHAVEVALASDLPLVRADPSLLHHCLINLLDNAGRHSGAGAPIRISGREEGGGVALSIEDKGRGLPDGAAPFDAFDQIEGSDQTGGAGLGLAIVKAFSEAMGVEPLAARRAGGGAAFTLRFPAGLIIEPANSADAG